VIVVRDATEADLPAVLDLYNALVPTTTVAWTDELMTPDQLDEWYAAHHCVLVADDDGDVVGYAGWGDFRNSQQWPGYRFTGEHSIHVRGDRHGTGVGRLLLETLLARAAAAGLHVMVAAVDAANESSIRFHERLGFVEVARMPEVGRKFDRWLDLVLLQRVL
jgi:phosphinothricin acetyltransferase